MEPRESNTLADVSKTALEETDQAERDVENLFEMFIAASTDPGGATFALLKQAITVSRRLVQDVKNDLKDFKELSQKMGHVFREVERLLKDFEVVITNCTRLLDAFLPLAVLTEAHCNAIKKCCADIGQQANRVTKAYETINEMSADLSRKNETATSRLEGFKQLLRRYLAPVALGAGGATAVAFAIGGGTIMATIASGGTLLIPIAAIVSAIGVGFGICWLTSFVGRLWNEKNRFIQVKTEKLLRVIGAIQPLFEDLVRQCEMLQVAADIAESQVQPNGLNTKKALLDLKSTLNDSHVIDIALQKGLQDAINEWQHENKKIQSMNVPKLVRKLTPLNAVNMPVPEIPSGNQDIASSASPVAPSDVQGDDTGINGDPTDPPLILKPVRSDPLGVRTVGPSTTKPPVPEIQGIEPAPSPVMPPDAHGKKTVKSNIDLNGEARGACNKCSKEGDECTRFVSENQITCLLCEHRATSHQVERHSSE